MVGLSRLCYGLLILTVHAVRALSFPFGRKQEVPIRKDSLKQQEGVLSRLGGYFSKQSGKDDKTNVDHKISVENSIPTQLRSLDVKSSNKRWIPHRDDAKQTKKTLTRSAGSIATANIDDQKESAHIPTLEYMGIGPEPTANRPTFFSSGGLSLQHLNTLAGRHMDVYDDAAGSDSVAGDEVNATMAFRIEITHSTAEITVSMGVGVGTGKDIDWRSAEQQGTSDKVVPISPSSSEHSSLNPDQKDHHHVAEVASIPAESMVVPAAQELYGFEESAHVAIEQPLSVATLLYAHQAQSSYSKNDAPMFYNSAPPPVSHSRITTTTDTTTTTDLSYMALFCFGLGILCAYALAKLYTAVSTWYRGRMPRYIAGLERQAIALLSAHKYAEAKTLLSRSLPVVEGHLGPRHTDVAAFRHFLAKALLALGEHRAAQGLLRSVVVIYETYGEDLYMAHALEDLALAQQDHSETSAGGRAEDSDRAGESTRRNAAALGTMKRALRIFTEEALAAEAIERQREMQSPESECDIEEEAEEEEGCVGQDYVSSPSCSDTTCDSSCLTVASSSTSGTSICGVVTPGEFSIRSSNNNNKSDDGRHGSALWDRELLTSVSEEEGGEVEHSGVDVDSCSESGGCSGKFTTHSLDSQDPHSPIYAHANSDAGGGSGKVTSMYVHTDTVATKKTVLGELAMRGYRSPVKRSVSSRPPLSVAATGTEEAEHSKKSTRSTGKKGKKSTDSNSNGGSPDNENTDPNNRRKPASRAASSPQPARSAPHRLDLLSTPRPTSTTCTAAGATPAATSEEEEKEVKEDVSLCTALADLERLLAQPAPSPNTLLGPAAFSPESLCLDYSADYDWSSGVTADHGDVSINNVSASIDGYADVYDRSFESAVKATSNPLFGDFHSLSVVKDLNKLLSRTPDSKAHLNEENFEPIECVKDAHVGRVLHRVASLLGRLGRQAECVAYLHAASTVYCLLHGAESDLGRAIYTEIVNCQRCETEYSSCIGTDVSSVYNVHSDTDSVGSGASEVCTPLTSPQRRGRMSKK